MVVEKDKSKKQKKKNSVKEREVRSFSSEG